MQLYNNLLFLFRFYIHYLSSSLKQSLGKQMNSVNQPSDQIWFVIDFVSQIIVLVLLFRVAFGSRLIFRVILPSEWPQLLKYEWYFECVPKHQLSSYVDSGSNHFLQRKILPYLFGFYTEKSERLKLSYEFMNSVKQISPLLFYPNE